METSPFEGVFDALYNEATQSLFLAEHEMSLLERQVRVGGATAVDFTSGIPEW